MAQTLEMIFKTDQGKDVTYAISDPAESITKSKVDTYMTNCITKNIFANKSGKLTAIVKSQIKEIVITPLA